MHRTLAILACLGLSAPAAAQVDAPSRYTLDANRRAAAAMPVADRRDEDFATRGFLGTRSDPIIPKIGGGVAVDLSALDFLKGDAPPTVNPSLWRQSRLTARHGLFQVTENIYQVRGFDTANITFARGRTGWIIIDTLTNIETARAAYELVTEKLGRRPISAIIYTHSHGDHFGGAEGLKPYLAPNAPILAPVGFMKAAISESVIAGPTMARRAAYQFGMPLEHSVTGELGLGIGGFIPRGTRGLLPPTAEISQDGVQTIDGVRLDFQLTLGTEAPAEMNIGFPDWKVIDLAENANPTHHNILTPRGALTRDAKAWADGLTRALEYLDGAEAMITSHGWPRFGAQEVREFLTFHRDSYAYLHDQTVRLMNQGRTGEEIGAQLKLPPALYNQWYNRPYYGSFSFNARAVYQYYMGWYDANPVNLAPMAQEERGRRYVEAMGGSARVREMGKAAYDSGDYAWAAELLNRLVFAEPGDAEAKDMLARSYQQLAWQSENSLARNMYLTGAQELRGGPSVPSRPGDGGFLAVLPSSDIFDMLATRIDPARTGTASLRIRFVFSDRDNEVVVMRIANGVMTHDLTVIDGPVDATVTGSRPEILKKVMGTGAVDPAMIQTKGDAKALDRLSSWLDQPDPRFAIVTP